MKRRITIGMLVVLSLLVVGCVANDQVKKDMAEFDRAYIPVLALTSQEKLEPSQKSMEVLKETWNQFKNKYYDYDVKEANWQQGFDEIENTILRADKIIANKQNLIEAHKALEKIRLITMNLRKEEGMDYYLDYLTEFHEPMEIIVLTANQHKVTKEDIKIIEETLVEAIREWEEVEEATFNNDIFAFNKDKLSKMKKAIQAERASLNKLKEVLETGDKKEIIKAAKKIKPNFAKLFKLFGNFKRLK